MPDEEKNMMRVIRQNYRQNVPTVLNFFKQAFVIGIEKQLEILPLFYYDNDYGILFRHFYKELIKPAHGYFKGL